MDMTHQFYTETECADLDISVQAVVSSPYRREVYVNRRSRSIGNARNDKKAPIGVFKDSEVSVRNTSSIPAS